MNIDKEEKHRLISSLYFPLILVLTIIIVEAFQSYFALNLIKYGIYPQKVSSLTGIIFSPFIHADFNHVFNNSIPLLILGTSLFYFYKPIALKLIVLIVLMGGFWTWILARESYHVGASGLVYGLFSFLLVSGFIRMNKQLIALSLFVVVVYGSLVWGIFPIKGNISYEAHFWGFFSGIILAIFYRKHGKQKEVFVWEEEEEDDENKYWESGYNSIDVNLTIKKTKE